MGQPTDDMNASLEALEAEVKAATWWKHLLAGLYLVAMPIGTIPKLLFLFTKFYLAYVWNLARHPKLAYKYAYSFLWYRSHIKAYMDNFSSYIEQALKGGATVGDINKSINPNYVDAVPPNDKDLLN